MSRSFKKAIITISKRWDRHKEKKFRAKVKQELHNIEKEIDFDPDRDFEKSMDYGKMGSWGTRMGWEFESVKEYKNTWSEEEQKKMLEEERRK